jgi:broad specificity phosphatase PhoE
MTIWLEMHATSLDNEARLASGWYDVGLSPLGARQAQELGERRRHTGLAAIFCSDLRRAYDTAQIAFSDSVTPIVRDARLRECDYGTMNRHPVAEIDTRRLRSISEPFPGGESYEGATRRVAEWMREAAAGYSAETILVIGHRATFYALEHLCRGVPLAEVIAATWQWQPGWRYEVR